MTKAPNGTNFYFVREGFSGSPANDGWYSVEDCLPDAIKSPTETESSPVLVRLSCGDMFTARLADTYDAISWVLCGRDGYIVDGDKGVTHWRPLPSQPSDQSSDHGVNNNSLSKDGYIAVPNKGIDQEAFYASSWEELETMFRERNLKPSDFLIELASMSCHPIAASQSPLSKKLFNLIEGIAHGSFLGEDNCSRDYCIYCHAEYGNYEKFGYSKRTLEENHDKDCFYRLANEILEIMEKDETHIISKEYFDLLKTTNIE